MIIDHSDLSFDTKYGDKSNLIQEVAKIIILIEFLRKDLLNIMNKYIQKFSLEEKFDFSIPVAYIDFNYFIQNNYGLSEELMLEQLGFNLQLLSIKMYSLLEEDKNTLKKSKLKKLRLSFAHRKSSFVLSNKEKVVMFGGLSYDLNYFEIMNIGYKDDGVKNEIIPFYYGNYIELITKHLEHDLIENIKQVRELNQKLVMPIIQSSEVL